MSAFNLTNAQSIILTATELARTVYMQDTPDVAFRFGRTAERLFQPSERLADGNGITMQVIKGRSDSARATRSVYQDFGNANKLQSDDVQVRFSKTASANDFTRLEAIAEIPHLDLQRGDRAEAAVNIAEKVERQANENVADSFGILLYATGTGRVALVNGTPKQNDDLTWTDSSATPTNATGMRIKVDNGSIAPFEPGTVWDFYDANGVLGADAMRVVDKQPGSDSGEGSVGFEVTDNTTVTVLSGVTDNEEIFRSGERGQGYRGSLTEWCSAPSSGESFVGGLDRTAAANRWMIPNLMRQGATAATVNRDHLDEAALAMGYVHEEGMTPVILSNPSLIQTLRRSVGDDALRSIPADFGGNFTFGELGLAYVHPQFGTVTLLADPLAPTDRMFILTPQTWERIYYGFRGFEWMDSEMGIFFRKSGSLANGGKGVFYRAEGYQIDTPFCKEPRRNGVILNLKK